MNVPVKQSNGRSPFRAAGTLAIVASFVIVVAGMKAASAIVVPFLLAVFIAVIVTPLFIGLQRRGMRPVFALFVIVLLLVGVSAFLFLLLSNSLASFNKNLPEYQKKLGDQYETVIVWLEEKGVDLDLQLDRPRPPEDAPPEDGAAPGDGDESGIEEEAEAAEVIESPTMPSMPEGGLDHETADVVIDGEPTQEAIDVEPTPAAASGVDNGPPPDSPQEIGRKSLNVVLSYLGSFTRAAMGMLSQGFLILLVVIFILFEAMVLPSKVRALPGMDETQWTRLQTIVDNIRRYMAIKTLVSLLTGVLVALMLWILGIPFALLLGLLAFMLNFVPNVGSIIAAIPAVLLAVVDAGLGTAVGIAIGYVAINIGVGNGLEPRVMGRGLGLSPLIILLSLIFWGWVLGPVGMLLSVPLTMTGKIILEADPSTQWLALLMSGGARPAPSTPDVADSE